MNKILISIFNLSVLFLIIISLYPGSLIGFLLYNDLSKQPNLVSNPFGTTINHFIYYFYVTILGLSVYLKSNNFKNLVYGLFFLSIILEILQFFVPNRAFQVYDLLGNFFGVLVGYIFIKIYSSFNKL